MVFLSSYVLLLLVALELRLSYFLSCNSLKLRDIVIDCCVSIPSLSVVNADSERQSFRRPSSPNLHSRFSSCSLPKASKIFFSQTAVVIDLNLARSK